MLCSAMELSMVEKIALLLLSVYRGLRCKFRSGFTHENLKWRKLSYFDEKFMNVKEIDWETDEWIPWYFPLKCFKCH